ncbi:hydantoinase B/oxoprolinase family protein [Chloroflexota bacterium]
MSQQLDPVKYEIFRHRLFNILEEGRVAIKMVSGSSVVVEGGETMCCFCTRDGNTILVAAGVLLHAISARDFIRKTIEWYEEDPGFEDGDQLFFNDPYIGGQHLADQVIIKPIFYQGEHIAWTASIMHTHETGGMQPGGAPAKATAIFQEGFRIQGLKIVEKGKLRKDIYQSLLAQAWNPHLLGLDIKAKIAANNTNNRSYLRLVEQYGTDFVEAAGLRLIQESGDMSRAKLRKLPDGTWRSRLYGDTRGTKDEPYRVVCTMTKLRDEVTFDFTGSSPQNGGPLNCTLPATLAQLFVTLTSQLFWNIPWNEGMFAPVKVVAPEGTVVNCKFPAAVSRGVMTVGCLIEETVHECIAKMLYAGGLTEEVSSAWIGAGGARLSVAGLDQYDDPCGGPILDSFAAGIGATPFRDGVDSGGQMMNPQSTISDVEIIEMTYPIMYLTRRQATDSGGFGRFSGGMGLEIVYMAHRSKSLRVNLYRHSQKTPPNWGMFGGYPSAPTEAVIVLNPPLPTLFQQSKIPTGFESVEPLGGDIFNPSTPHLIPDIQVKEYDLFITHLNAGGGYGDPIDRATDAVLEDVKRAAISEDTAERLYGVVINHSTMQLDSEATRKRREVIVRERLSHGKMPCESNIESGPFENLSPKSVVRIHEYLEIADIDGRKLVRCLKCGHIFCDADDNYKKYALLRERNLSDVKLRALLSKEPIWVLYQEYICPGCGTLLEVDNVCPQLDNPDEWVLWDTQLTSAND